MPSPVSTVLRLFAVWKTALLLIAAGSALVGPAYDTSAGILLADCAAPTSNQTSTASAPPAAVAFLARLTSWDAVYFVTATDRGYVFEQEWAFGTGLPVVISSVLKALRHVGWTWDGVPAAALMGVVVAHMSHLLSALALLQLGNLVWHDQPNVALVAACLHVLSPAGLFLSAPYAEAPFSLLSFVGLLLFAKATAATPSGRGAASDACLLLSGISLGLATAFRSNGLLNGVPFAYAFVRELAALPSRPSVSGLKRLAALGLGGLSIAAGSIIPQAVAYQRYCSGASGTLSRPWCQKTIPSIYSFVQDRYWDNGFLRYWTVSNLPLFMLAAPMLYIMLRSGLEFLAAPGSSPRRTAATKSRDALRDSCVDLVRSMAAAQALLAVMALTNHHVQIITRLSSGYAIWYWWLARTLFLQSGKGSGFGRGFVVFMVMYGAIQAVLFSSFLPPA